MTFYAHPYAIELARNLCPDPAATDAANFAASSSGGTGNPTLSMLNTAAGLMVPTYANVTFTTATAGWAAASCKAVPVVGGLTYTMSCYGFQSVAGSSCIRIGWYTAAGVFISEYLGPVVSRAAGAWTRLSATVVAPANAAIAWVGYRLTNAAPAGTRIGITQLLAEAGSTLNPWYYGDSPATVTPPVEYRWLGAAGACASVKRGPSYAQIVEPTLVVAPWAAERAASSVVHRPLNDPSKQVVTWFPAGPRAGELRALFNAASDAQAAADLFASTPLLTFEPPEESPQMGVPLFAVTPGGQIRHGQVDEVDATDGDLWQVVIPWTEVTG